MDRVADPCNKQTWSEQATTPQKTLHMGCWALACLTLPALAWTTSVPPSCVRFVRASICSAERLVGEGVACENRGRMVTPAWPPMTGTSTSETFVPVFSA